MASSIAVERVRQRRKRSSLELWRSSVRAPASLEEAQTLLRRRVWPSNVKTPFKNKLEKVTEARRYGGLV